MNEFKSKIYLIYYWETLITEKLEYTNFSLLSDIIVVGA